MGVPGSSTGDTFHKWAHLPPTVSREQFNAEQKEQQRIHFPECAPLPGTQALLSTLSNAQNTNGQKVHIALASSSERNNFDLKTSECSETRRLLHMFDPAHRILGDDPRLEKGRGKPAPDIFLLALKSINSTLPESETPISSQECIVFEDSVPGVEAGRRAGMRVVWVPHQALLAEFKGKEDMVLAGRVGLIGIGNEEQLGEIGDGWAIELPSLEQFPYQDFDILPTAS